MALGSVSRRVPVRSPDFIEFFEIYLRHEGKYHVYTDFNIMEERWVCFLMVVQVPDLMPIFFYIQLKESLHVHQELLVRGLQAR